MPKVIVADALLDMKYTEYMKRLNRQDTITYHYIHRPYVDKQYRIINNKSALTHMICEAVKKGKKIVVPTNSEVYAKSIVEIIQNVNLDIKIGIYTGDNKGKKHEDVSKNWDKLQVLIYTPTITCGISFMEDHFDEIFAYFSTASCGPEEALQMLFRCRKINKMNICINKHPNNFLKCKDPDVKTLKDYMKYTIKYHEGGKQQQIFMNKSYLSDEIDTKCAYFYAYCCTIRRICEGYKNYENLLCLYLRDMGVRFVNFTNNINKDELTKLDDNMKTLKGILEEIDCIGITTSENIESKSLINGVINKTEEEKWMIKKYDIYEQYRIYCCDTAFVKNALKFNRVHRNTKLFYEASKFKSGSDEFNDKIEKIAKISSFCNNIDLENEDECTGKPSRRRIENRRKNEMKKDAILECEKLINIGKIYRMGICIFALNLIYILKANKAADPFVEDIDIIFDDTKRENTEIQTFEMMIAIRNIFTPEMIDEHIKNIKTNREKMKVTENDPIIKYDFDSVDIREYIDNNKDFISGYFKNDRRIQKLCLDNEYNKIIKSIIKNVFGLKVNYKTKKILKLFNFVNGNFYPMEGNYFSIDPPPTKYPELTKESDEEILLKSDIKLMEEMQLTGEERLFREKQLYARKQILDKKKYDERMIREEGRRCEEEKFNKEKQSNKEMMVTYSITTVKNITYSILESKYYNIIKNISQWKCNWYSVMIDLIVQFNYINILEYLHRENITLYDSVDKLLLSKDCLECIIKWEEYDKYIIDNAIRKDDIKLLKRIHNKVKSVDPEYIHKAFVSRKYKCLEYMLNMEFEPHDYEEDFIRGAIKNDNSEMLDKIYKKYKTIDKKYLHEASKMKKYKCADYIKNLH